MSVLGLLGLHRESSYALGPEATPEEVTMSEVARYVTFSTPESLFHVPLTP